MKTDIVEISGRLARTTSEAVALGCERSHKNTLALIRKYHSQFEELGSLAFETRMGKHGGVPVEVALLNEDQATFLITLFRNNDIVVAFKLRLVKEFRKALDTIGKRFAEPPRKSLLQDKRSAHHPMMDALIEVRAELGKETGEFHYMAENKLCNWAVTGRFEAIDETQLSNEEAILLKFVREQNRAYLEERMPYEERKNRLRAFSIRKRTKLLGNG
jgi:phage regulator Rha-like protein